MHRSEPLDIEVPTVIIKPELFRGLWHEKGPSVLPAMIDPLVCQSHFDTEAKHDLEPGHIRLNACQ
ncbi:hypothetical protein OAA27_00705 [bacterium]|nr:hypothetical protein [bacterium]